MMNLNLSVFLFFPGWVRPGKFEQKKRKKGAG